MGPSAAVGCGSRSSWCSMPVTVLEAMVGTEHAEPFTPVMHTWLIAAQSVDMSSPFTQVSSVVALVHVVVTPPQWLVDASGAASGPGGAPSGLPALSPPQPTANAHSASARTRLTAAPRRP